MTNSFAARIDEKTVGLWFLPLAPDQDWLCALREIEPEREYEIVCRFRYYKDDKPFDSEDVKNWYRARAKQTRAFVIAALRETARILRQTSQAGELYEFLNEGDFDAFWKKIMDAPFVFVRQVPNQPSGGPS